MNESYSSTDVGVIASGGDWPLLPLSIPWILPFLVWFITGIAMVLRETSVDKPTRIPQFYGYTVCLISLVIGLVSISSLINSAFERMNPLQHGYAYGQSLSSFEVFKAKRAMLPSFGRETPTPPDTASEATMRARYDALVADQILSVRYESSKSFVTTGLLLLIAIGLFGYHWRWMRRLSAPSAGA